MLLVATAWACERAVLDQIPLPPVASERPVVARAATESHGVKLAGARVTFRSAHPFAKWVPVMDRPEDQDEWAPRSLGTRRVERLGPNALFQQLDIRVVWGAVHIRRQVLVALRSLVRNDHELRNCWSAVDPAPYAAQIAPWVDDTPFQRHGQGGWDLYALPDGGTYVSYTLWADTGAMPGPVQSWAMSRTLPELMAAFEAHVGG
jgi:hypothetical protein